MTIDHTRDGQDMWLVSLESRTGEAQWPPESNLLWPAVWLVSDDKRAFAFARCEVDVHGHIMGVFTEVGPS